MEYRCKVTVIDKKHFPELQKQYCAVPDSGRVRASTRETNLYSIGMGNVMTTGIWGQEL